MIIEPAPYVRAWFLILISKLNRVISAQVSAKAISDQDPVTNIYVSAIISKLTHLSPKFRISVIFVT